MPGARRAAIALLAAAAFAGAGCGSDDDDTARPAETRAQPAAGTMPPAQYADEFGQIVTRMSDARSAYFHGSNERSEERRQLRALHRSLTSGIAQLESIEPPATAADLHGRALDLMRKRASQLEEILAADRYDRERASDLMAEMDRDGGTYDEIYSLPQ